MSGQFKLNWQFM